MTSPPAILVGADTVNAVSILRSLARAGVDVHLLCRSRALPARSRYGRRISLPGDESGRDAWVSYLLSGDSDHLRGAVLLACNDDGVEVLLENREVLREKFVLDISDPAAQRCMLDKLATYRAAAEAGVPTPRFWPAGDIEQVRAHESEYTYPLMLKPLYSHQFKKVLNGKYLMARDFNELLAGYERVAAHGVEVVLLEMIPGPDDLLCSYYTYLDEDGSASLPFHEAHHPQVPGARGFRLLPRDRLEPGSARPRAAPVPSRRPQRGRER